jgi:hypothetical protein
LRAQCEQLFPLASRSRIALFFSRENDARFEKISANRSQRRTEIRSKNGS